MTGVGFLLKKAIFPKGNSLLSLALWISVSGVALGVAMLILVLSVMSGFLGFLQDHYIQITSPIVVIARTGEIEEKDLVDKITQEPGVQAVSPFLMTQGMVVKNGVGGVTLEGVSLSDTHQVTPWNQIWLEAPDEANQPSNWIWIGKSLADKLKVKVGDNIDLMMGRDSNILKPFVVTAITKFGIYEHDLRYAYMDLERMKEIYQPNGPIPFYKVAVNKSEIEKVAGGLREKFEGQASVKRWSDINQNIFKAVNHQKMMLFWVLDIVIALAGMNVINLLMMNTYQKKRDVAILKAMGMRLRGILLFFVGQGTFVGVVGIAVGVVVGLLLCQGVEAFQPAILSESIYNVTKLPLKVQVKDVFAVSSVAILLCLIFSVIPALKAATAPPVQALRYE